MSFGIPCDTQPDPSSVYTATAEIDTLLSSVVDGIQQQLTQWIGEIGAWIMKSYDTLRRSVANRIGKVDSQIETVFNALQRIVTSLTSVANVDMSTALTSISTALQITPEQLYLEPLAPFPGLAPSIPPAPGKAPRPSGVPYNVPPLGFPPSTVPTLPGELPPAPTVPPTTIPIPGTPPTTLPPSIPPSITVSVNGVPVSLTQLVAPVQLGGSIVVDGNTYNPTYSVWQNAQPLTVNAAGNTVISVSVDPQPDGSTVVTVGNVSVAVAAPSADPSAPSQQCNLEPQSIAG
jgi:hypothetical protein